MCRTLIALVVLAASAGALAGEPVMKKEGAAEYFCGGVGLEERDGLKSLAAKANVELVFATAKRGAYIADVSLAITDAKSGSPVLKTVAEGPICVLRLAPGNYRIEASYAKTTRAHTFSVRKEAAAPARVGFGFPEDAGEVDY